MKHKSRGDATSRVSPTRLSTPSSPLDRPRTSSGKHFESRPPELSPIYNMNAEDALGQFSYGPATQTTVVTTTTTTTTNFPPLMLRAPRNLHDLDPKLYPLAGSPTPSTIRRLTFEVDGMSTTFQEAEDTLQAIEQFTEQEVALSRSHGSLKSVSSIPETTSSQVSRPLPLPLSEVEAKTIPQSVAKTGSKRPASPISISEAARIAAEQGPRKKRLMAGPPRTGGGPRSKEPQSRMHRPRLDILQTSTPITPHGTEIDSSRTTRASVNRYQPSLDANTQSQGPMPPSTSYLYGAEPQILSPKSDDGRIDNGSPALSHPHSFTDSDTTVGWRIPSPGPAMTPQRELENSQFDDLDVPAGSTQEPRPRPQALNTTAAQGVSLPSPSLSPVTAAAQLHNRSFNTERNTGARSNELDRSKQASQPHPDPTSDVIPWSRSQLSNSQLSSSLTQASMPESAPSLEKYIDKSLMCIPQIVDNFESMPEEIKKYVVFQVLRRCSKPVLHFVADVVNPSLKCDFLKHLPPELCEAILSHLDVRDLCSAAQVSKKWQQQVDLSEKVWRRVFVEDGFTLQEGELARAIREGWGWQTVSQPGDAELDLSLQTASKNEGGPPAPLTTRDSAEVHFRSKRKHKSRAKTSNKFSKRKRQMNLSDTAEVDEDALLVMTSATDGPYAAATAAAAAISSRPRNELHLWKSIYMRHHMIRKTWLREDVTPRHIAFRAHQRHVVTCLQFDADKILTGSDDANINVYDTQTGALRARLEGHEGGVWALQYEGNVLVSGSTDRSVRVWDIERGICTHTFQGHTSTVRCLQILLPTPVGSGLDGRPILMPKQPLIITGSRDSHLRVWKLPKSGDPHLHQAGPAQDESTESPYYVRVLTGHHHSVRAIAAHADTLVSGSYDCTVRVWKISTGETLFRLQGHAQKVYSVVLDTKRNRCISGSMDNVVKVWSLDNGMSLFNLEGHSSLVGLLDLQDDRLVSAAADSTLRIWDPENGHCKNTLTAHTGAITCFQHDGQKVISGSDRTLKMWNVISGELVKDLLTDLSGVWQVKFNERRCVAAVQRNNVTFIEVLDFGACRDGVPEHKRGKRILVDIDGREVIDPHDTGNDIDFLDGQ